MYGQLLALLCNIVLLLLRFHNFQTSRIIKTILSMSVLILSHFSYSFQIWWFNLNFVQWHPCTRIYSENLSFTSYIGYVCIVNCLCVYDMDKFEKIEKILFLWIKPNLHASSSYWSIPSDFLISLVDFAAMYIWT